MFRTAFALELRKQRGSFRAVILVVLLGLFSAGLYGFLIRRWNFADVQTGTWGVLVAGIPFLGVILGVIGGGGLRREPIRSIEEVFPVSPLPKVVAAYCASLIYFLIVGFVLPLVICTPQVLRSVSNILALQLFSQLSLFWPILAASHFHFLAFAFAYWTRNPILGGGLAIIAAGIEMGLIMIPFLSPFLLLGWLTGFGSLVVLARRLERGLKLGYLRGTIAAAGFMVGSVLSGLMAYAWFASYGR